MIKMQKTVPDVYYQQSRDFQFIARLYELVLNSVKTNSDMIYYLPNSEDANEAFLELLSTTLGFRTLHNYNIPQLKSLCSCFAEVIRNKGNIQSIEKACNALIGAEGITESIYIDSSDPKSGLILYVPNTLSDTTLLKDLMDYILPAGLRYNIVKVLKVSRTLNTEIGIASDVQAITHGGAATSIISDTFSSTETESPNLLDTAGMLINSTVIDTYGYDLNIVYTMVTPDKTLILDHCQLDIVENQQYPGGTSKCPKLTLVCDGGYRMKNNTYEGIWLQVADLSEDAYVPLSSDVTVTHITSTNKYDIVFNKMPEKRLNITIEIEEGEG